jgi:hypothetical protein
VVLLLSEGFLGAAGRKLVTGSYVWAHDLVTLHYSDNQTDYPALFELWQPVELDKLEEGLRAAQVNLKESKAAFKDTEPRKWRAYLLGVWQRQQKKDPELKKLYDHQADDCKSGWFKTGKRPIRNYTCRLLLTVGSPNRSFVNFLDKNPAHGFMLGPCQKTDRVNLKTGQISLGEFAKKLKEEHLAAMKNWRKSQFFQKKHRFISKVKRKFITVTVRRTKSIPLANNAW